MHNNFLTGKVYLERDWLTGEGGALPTFEHYYNPSYMPLMSHPSVINGVGTGTYNSYPIYRLKFDVSLQSVPISMTLADDINVFVHFFSNQTPPNKATINNCTSATYPWDPAGPTPLFNTVYDCYTYMLNSPTQVNKTYYLPLADGLNCSPLSTPVKCSGDFPLVFLKNHMDVKKPYGTQSSDFSAYPHLIGDYCSSLITSAPMACDGKTIQLKFKMADGSEQIAYLKEKNSYYWHGNKPQSYQEGDDVAEKPSTTTKTVLAGTTNITYPAGPCLCSEQPTSSACSTDSACNDSKKCTVDTCSHLYGCLNKVDTAIAGCCITNSDCNDNNACTDDSCNINNECVFTVDKSNVYDDRNACTIDSCASGAPSTALKVCNDNKPCTTDTCNTSTGCVFSNVANGTSCDDGLLCTDADKCTSGVCGGTNKTCNDGNVCTNDVCNSITGCQNDPNANSCNDGETCTTTDVCSGGVCVGTAPDADSDGVTSCTDCNDADVKNFPGNTEICDLKDNDCDNQADEGFNEGNSCTAGIGACLQNGRLKCQANGTVACDKTGADQTLVCNDSLTCTTDKCAAVAGGCTHDVIAGSCLIGGVCFSNGIKNPANQCQVCNSILTKTAWSNVTTGTSCNDSNACTSTDTCNASGVCSGSTINCADTITCTTDTCDTVTGCKHVADNSKCSDGKDCTDDTCSPAAGCQNEIHQNKCLIGGTCFINGALNPANQCQFCGAVADVGQTSWKNLTNGTACNDQNACTTPDACSSGACVGTNVAIDGKWSEWGACSGGFQSRTCSTPSCGGVTNCPGSSTQACCGNGTVETETGELCDFNNQDDNADCTTDCKRFQDIPLVTGWNLISIGLDPTSPNIIDIFSGMSAGYVVQTFETAANLWFNFIEGQANNTLTSLTKMVLNKGYWVRVATNQTLRIKGSYPDPASNNITLVPGWNLVGFQRIDKKPVSTVLGQITAQTQLYYYQSETWSSYAEFIPATLSELNDLSEIRLGRGYWLNIDGTQQQQWQGGTIP